MTERPALVLASSSPRRAELLTVLGLHFSVQPATVDETPRATELPHEHVSRLAREKASAVARPDRLVIAADTAVIIDERILGKPADEAEARLMLRTLSGRAHQVQTGVAAALGGEGSERRIVDAVVSTHVWFTDLVDADINWYLATGEPFDKAGAYGIQGAGGLFVESIQGSYHNVVGLPLVELDQLVRELGHSLRDWSG